VSDGGSVYANGYLYVFGGSYISGGVKYSNKIFYTQVNSDGTLGSWTTSTTNLPATRGGIENSVIFAPNGYIYILGGEDGSATYNSVWYVKPNSDGSLPAITVSSNSLLAVRRYGAVAIANGYLYYVGGTDNSGAGTPLANVYYASYNADGTTSSFTNSSQPLPSGTMAISAEVLNNNLYVVGGNNGTSALDTIMFASLGVNGVNGAWTTDTNRLPSIRNYFGSANYNGYIYVIQGSDGATRYNTVYYTSASRFQIAGSLDLLGNSGGSNALLKSGTGGSLTAGNTLLSGTLTVSDVAEFYNGLNVNGAVSIQGSSDTGYVAQITNTSTGASSDGLLINLGVASRSATNYFVGFANNGTISGKIQGSGANVAYTTSGADYAEYFRADENNLPQPAELVSQDLGSSNSVVLSSSPNKPIVGIVSSSPGFIGNGPICEATDNDCEINYSKYNALVALNGQVPLTVDIDVANPINIGDPITVSSITPGHGAKATASGYIIGYALTTPTYQQQEQSVEGGQAAATVQVLIRPTYYNPITELQNSNSTLNTLAITGSLTVNNLVLTGSATVADLVVTGNTTAQGNLAVATDLTVGGKTTLNDLYVNGHLITSSGGLDPTIGMLSAAGSNNTNVVARGNDISGMVTVTTGDPGSEATETEPTVIGPVAGELVKINFGKSYDSVPRIIVAGNDAKSAMVQVYPSSITKDGFSIAVSQSPDPNTTYSFTYWIVQ
jgi:hypothetical protein